MSTTIFHDRRSAITTTMHSTLQSEPDISGNSTAVLTRQDSRLAVDSRFCCNICFDAVVEPVATLCGHLYCWPCLFRWLEPGMSPEERNSLGIPPLSLANDPNRRVCPVCKAHCSVPALVPIYVREPVDSEIHDSTAPSSWQGSSASTSAEHRSHSRSQSQSQSTNELHDTDSNQGDVPHPELQPTGSDASSSQAVDWSASGESITGLRQRIRFRSRDSENSVDSVPSRPAAQSPRQHSPSSPPSSTPHTPQRYGTSSWAPLTPTGPRGGSLTYGLLLSLQQATAGSSRVPPLHRRDGVHPADLEAQSGATEYLSRLLLMLACFVMLCLLLL